MIETYFGLTRRPFLAVPDVSSYFPSETIDSARTNVLRCLYRGEGVSLIVGPSGVGKTLLLRLLGLPFHLDYAVVPVSNHRLKSPKAFLQQVLFELQQPFCGSEENELRLLLRDHLRRSTLPGVILLIDEGQTLSLSVLEEIRQMLNYDNGMFSRFRVAIAGTLELEERLTHPKLKAFNQWIVSRSYLEPFTRTETSEYILWQMQNARKSEPTESRGSATSLPFSGPLSESGSPRKYRVDSPHHHSEQFPLFDEFARSKIYELTGGIPRFVNQLCDHALVLACETGRSKTIDEPFVRAAWASLQQIPESAPESQSFGMTAGSSSPGDTVIEFGTLDDSPVDNRSAVPGEEEQTPPFVSDADTGPNLIRAEELELLLMESAVVQEPTVQEPTVQEPVTKKPNDHVYQVKSFYNAAYPVGPQAAMENWISPGHQVDCGVGTAYREILYRDLADESHEAASQRAHLPAQTYGLPDPVPGPVVLPPGMVVEKAKMDDSRQSLPGFGPEDFVQGAVSAEFPAEFQGSHVSGPSVSEPQNSEGWSAIPTSAFRPDSTPVIRLFLGDESDRPAEPARLKLGGLKTLQESFDEEIPVSRSYRSATRSSPPCEGPGGSSRVLVHSGKSGGGEALPEHLTQELRQLQQSLAQGIAFCSVQRVVSLLEETQREGSAENEDRPRTLRFDPAASRASSGSILSKPKFLAKPPTDAELVTLDFPRESRHTTKTGMSGREDGSRQQEARKMWIHSEPKANDRPRLKLRTPMDAPSVQEPDISDGPLRGPVAEDEAPERSKGMVDFDALFSKFYG